ncbi:STAS domain-containing protein [Streptomyces sp. DSM 118878]
MAESLSTPPRGLVLVVATAGAGHAVLTLGGDVGSDCLRELEGRLCAPPVSEAVEWTVDMSGVTRFDLACAYALLRAATLRPHTAVLRIRGARRPVQRTLRHAGLEAVAVFEG